MMDDDGDGLQRRRMPLYPGRGGSRLSLCHGGMQRSLDWPPASHGSVGRSLLNYTSSILEGMGRREGECLAIPPTNTHIYDRHTQTHFVHTYMDMYVVAPRSASRITVQTWGRVKITGLD